MAVESTAEVPSLQKHRVGGPERSVVPGPASAATIQRPLREDVPHYLESQGVIPAAAAWRGNTAALLLGRAIFGGFFLYNGIGHFLNGEMLTEYARAKKVPMPEAAVRGSGAMLIAGGLSLITGVRPKVGAALAAAFLLAVSPRMHAFWDADDQQTRMQELVNFTKNMALLGGACLAAAIPEPWPASLDARGGRLVPSGQAAAV